MIGDTKNQVMQERVRVGSTSGRARTKTEMQLVKVSSHMWIFYTREKKMWLVEDLLRCLTKAGPYTLVHKNEIRSGALGYWYTF